MLHCEICSKPLTGKQRRYCSRGCKIKGQAKISNTIRHCANEDCNVILDRKHTTYCSNKCMLICKRQNKRKEKPKPIKKEERIKKEEMFDVVCKCPACPDEKAFYTVKMLYKPFIMPRVYCETHADYRYRSEE